MWWQEQASSQQVGNGRRDRTGVPRCLQTLRTALASNPSFPPRPFIPSLHPELVNNCHVLGLCWLPGA